MGTIAARDALRVHLGGVDVLSEAEIRKDADFARGVDAFDVGGGVSLGKAVFLGLMQRVLKGGAVGDHLR